MTPVMDPNLSDPRFAPDDSGHGPECPFGTGEYPWYWDAIHRSWRRRNARGRIECACTRCYCGDDHEPGGPVGACRRCHRPLIVDGRVVR